MTHLIISVYFLQVECFGVSELLKKYEHFENLKNFKTLKSAHVRLLQSKTVPLFSLNETVKRRIYETFCSILHDISGIFFDAGHQT